jgi:hypothetical protein
MLFWAGFGPTIADAADGADGIIEKRAHPDCFAAGAAFTTEGNVDAEHPKKCLCPTQVPGESAGIFGPAGAVAWLTGAFNADPQKIGGATRPGAALAHELSRTQAAIGIAGEDDLDAPDLGADPTPRPEQPRPGRQSNGQTAAARPRADGDRKRPDASVARSVLGEQLSASLRESLIDQMATINTADEAAAWAHRSLPAKNTLTTADAKLVEERFQARLSTISNGLEPAESSNTRSPPQSVDVAAQAKSDTVANQAGSTEDPSQKGPTRVKKKSRREIAKRFVSATRITEGSCCGRPVSCAAACRPTPITSPLHSPGHLGVGLATSSSSRSAGSTTASCIAQVTRQHGAHGVSWRP